MRRQSPMRWVGRLAVACAGAVIGLVLGAGREDAPATGASQRSDPPQSQGAPQDRADSNSLTLSPHASGRQIEISWQAQRSPSLLVVCLSPDEDLDGPRLETPGGIDLIGTVLVRSIESAGTDVVALARPAGTKLVAAAYVVDSLHCEIVTHSLDPGGKRFAARELRSSDCPKAFQVVDGTDPTCVPKGPVLPIGVPERGWTRPMVDFLFASASVMVPLPEFGGDDVRAESQPARNAGSRSISANLVPGDAGGGAGGVEVSWRGQPESAILAVSIASDLERCDFATGIRSSGAIGLCGTVIVRRIGSDGEERIRIPAQIRSPGESQAFILTVCVANDLQIAVLSQSKDVTVVKERRKFAPGDCPESLHVLQGTARERAPDLPILPLPVAEHERIMAEVNPALLHAYTTLSIPQSGQAASQPTTSP